MASNEERSENTRKELSEKGGKGERRKDTIEEIREKRNKYRQKKGSEERKK